jgi:cytochrome c oxidase assembly protein subunit 15
MSQAHAGHDAAEVPALAFGIAVATWAVGYACRLPAVNAPGPVVLALMLGCFAAGGFAAGRIGSRGVRGGLYAGLLAGTINLLVLGSLLSGGETNRIVPTALLWLPGSIVATAALGSLGAWIGSRRRPAEARPPDWTFAFATIAASATFLLVVAGGLVTSARAGLAVVDWPNSFGYNMFLYPLSRMTGGIYYEHAHRLFGSLVGLTTVTLAVLVTIRGGRPWVRRVALAAVPLVILQGILGGLRVTGRFTLSADPAMTMPSTTLAVVHGALGQIFLATLAALAAFLSPRFKEGPAARRDPAATRDRRLAVTLSALLLVQLVLGAMERHLAHGLAVHIGMASIVAPLAVAIGFRAWGLRAGETALRRLGLALVIGAGAQLLLGFAAYFTVVAGAAGVLSTVWRLTVATAHQGMGAILLAAAVLLSVWSYRLLEPEG